MTGEDPVAEHVVVEHASVLIRFWPILTALFFAGLWTVRQTVTTPKSQIRQLQTEVTALRADIDEVRIAQANLAARIDRVLELLTTTHLHRRREDDPKEI